MTSWQPAEDPRTRPLRSWAFDIGCAVVAGAASLGHFLFGQTAHPVHLPVAASLAVAVLTAAALPLRRVRPGPVFVWTLLAAAVLAQWPAHGALFPVALAVSLYSVAVTLRRAEAIAAAVLVVGVVLLVVAQDGTRHWGLAVTDAAGLAGAVLLVGLYVGTRRAYLAELRDRAGRLERERDASSALAAAEERARIAREMHDSVAHHLTVIVALSDGALRAVTRSPAEASDAIRDVSSTARQALSETRRVLGVLRTGPGQEALTNTMKHAGPRVSAAVRLQVSAGEVQVDVRMPGRDGIEATRDIVAAGLPSKVLILTTFDLDDYISSW